MSGQADPRREQVMGTNAALRAWAEGLRAWSRTTRGASADHRRRARQLRLLQPVVVGISAPCGDGLPPLDPIPVPELLELLVRDHGLDLEEAARALATGMLAAGYPTDFDRVGVADAFDLVEEILNGRPW